MVRWQHIITSCENVVNKSNCFLVLYVCVIGIDFKSFTNDSLFCKAATFIFYANNGITFFSSSWNIYIIVTKFG